MPSNPVQCGWQSVKTVSALRVSRGSIDVNGTLQYDQGDPAEIANIEAVLKHEYPFVEILVLCATLVGPICILLGLCSWFIIKPKGETTHRGLYRRL